jgi:hypothetical protein
MWVCMSMALVLAHGQACVVLVLATSLKMLRA